MAKFILSKSTALAQYDAVKRLGIVSYSFKTNPEVGKLLEQEQHCSGCMFSVHFVNELNLIRDKKQVWFLAQALQYPLLDNLFMQDVDKFVVENVEDLDLLLKYIAEKNKKISLLLRMKLRENTIKTEKHYVFGMDASIVNELIPKLKKNRHIEKLGVHFHRKTQNVSEWELQRELYELIDESNWAQIDFLNIGGGIPVMYKNITDRIIPSVMKKLDELKSWLEKKNVALIIEPGRFISGPAIRLETGIVGIHGNTIVVDASVYNASPDTLIVPIKLLVEGETESGNAYVIKGITPCSTDLFRYRVYFPKEKEFAIGDKIIFLNAGAYNFHTEFCELDKVPTEIVE